MKKPFPPVKAASGGKKAPAKLCPGCKNSACKRAGKCMKKG